MTNMDQSGLVLIDEVEAQEDIVKLKKTVDLMNDALQKLNMIESVNSASKGDVTVAVDNITAELIKQINNQKKEIEYSIKVINELIDKYKNKDASIKNQINSSIS